MLLGVGAENKNTREPGVAPEAVKVSSSPRAKSEPPSSVRTDPDEAETVWRVVTRRQSRRRPRDRGLCVAVCDVVGAPDNNKANVTPKRIIPPTHSCGKLPAQMGSTSPPVQGQPFSHKDCRNQRRAQWCRLSSRQDCGCHL